GTDGRCVGDRYCFWYKRKGGGSGGGPAASQDYESSIKPISSFKTVERFWSIYNHLQRPEEVPTSTDYHLFKDGIKPAWEDGSNARGGQWTLRLKKGLAGRYWEELLLAVIGEQFDVGNEICGCVVSVRYNEDIISLWNRNADNREATERIRESLRRLLKLPFFIHFEYRRHQARLLRQRLVQN
ncbi:unnamed protein product, partial [Phaeothamnion confervicola]